MSTFGGLDTLFNPAKRHLDEEKLRLQSTREDVGDASGGKRIDLDSGKVKIGRASQNGAELDGDDPVDGDDTAAEDTAVPAALTTAGTLRNDAHADADAENTPAARARRRRAGKA